MRVSECYTFELAIITRSRYKRAALFTNGIISITSVLQYLSKTVTMVHTSKVYKYASYEEYRDNGMLSSEANCMHYAVPLRPEDPADQSPFPPLLRPDGSTGVPSYEVQRRMLLEVQVWENYHP